MITHVDLHLHVEELDIQTPDGLFKQFVLSGEANKTPHKVIFNDPIECLNEARRVLLRWEKVVMVIQNNTKKNMKRIKV